MILAGLRGSLNSLLWALGLLHRVRFVCYSSVFYWDGLSSCTELDPAQSQSKSLSSLHSSFDHPANWTIINQKQEHVYSLSSYNCLTNSSIQYLHLCHCDNCFPSWMYAVLSNSAVTILKLSFSSAAVILNWHQCILRFCGGHQRTRH